jgi:glucose/arabinose dehydrogenase
MKLACLLIVLLCAFTKAQPNEYPPPVTLELVSEGFEMPLYVTSPPDDERLFVVNRIGTVQIVLDGRVLSTLFLDIRHLVSLEGEMGLLSVAFHPDYRKNGRVFVLFTRAKPFDTVVTEFRRDPENPHRTLPFMRVVFTISQKPESIIHRGGHLEFGPDGKLYMSTGDAGLKQSQDQSWNGKMIRLDVDAPADMPLGSPYDEHLATADIYAKGLRNGWRFSFDPITHDLYLGDVGSSNWEEINIITEGGNYGWPYAEGNDCLYAQYVFLCHTVYERPVYQYRHLHQDASGGMAVVGGYVYRGQQKELQGYYIFADVIGRLWALQKTQDGWQRWNIAQPWGGIVSLGKGANGELYAVNITNGSLYHLKVKPTDVSQAQLLFEKPATVAMDGMSELIDGQRWFHGSESSVRFYFEQPLRLALNLQARHSFVEQCLKVSLNGEERFNECIPETVDLNLTLDMIAGVNELRFELSEWADELSSPYGLELTAFRLSTVYESSRDAGE